MTLSGISLNHSKIYFWGLVLAAVSLPLSKFTLTISYVFLLVNWILEGNYLNRLRLLKKSIVFWSLLTIFLVHLFWLYNSSNIPYAFHDLKNKIILVLFPFIIYSSNPISADKLKKILLWFSAAVIVSSLISTSILIGIIDIPILSFRGISLFISHIRFALLINVAIFSLGYIAISYKSTLTDLNKAGLIFSSLWLVVFLFLLKSLTGIIIFLIVLFVILGFISFNIKYIVYRLFLQLGLLTVLLVAASYITHSISKFYSIEKINADSLEIYTPSGNVYTHNLNDKQIENGNYVWLYYCPQEVENEWNKISTIPINSLDQKDQQIRFTVIRYLTSKGLRKDSVGVSQLTDKDIKNIESGLANYIFTDRFSLYPRIYQVLWEIDVYLKNQNPAGNSTTQRIIFMKTAFKIINDNIWTGVGTGDVQDAFNQQYIKDNSQLPLSRRLRAHNQFITFLLTFGILGFIIILFALFIPLFHLRAYRSYLFMVFFLIAIISMLNEDTLETQTGVSFFSYFYSLFLLKLERNKYKSKNNEEDE